MENQLQKNIAFDTFIDTYILIYTGCSLKKVGAVIGSMEELRRTKKSYTILPISQ